MCLMSSFAEKFYNCSAAYLFKLYEMIVMGFKAIHLAEIPLENVEKEGFKGTRVRWLITKEDGAENFAMRYFEIAPKGASALHTHKWEHEVFILDGSCLVVCGNEKKKVGPSYVVFIPPNVPHCFKNVGEKPLKFLCLVPYM